VAIRALPAAELDAEALSSLTADGLVQVREGLAALPDDSGTEFRLS